MGRLERVEKDAVKSYPVSNRFLVQGQVIEVTLDKAVWKHLAEISIAEEQSISRLIEKLGNVKHPRSSMESAIRVLLVAYDHSVQNKHYLRSYPGNIA